MRTLRLAGLGLCLTGIAAPSPALPQEAVRAGRAARPDAAIRIYALTGSLRVIAWTRDSVEVRGRVDSESGRFFLGGTPEALKLGIEAPEDRAPEGTADLEVRIPVGARVWLKTAAADADLTLAGGTVEVAGMSGRVRVAGRAERVIVETIDGNVELALEGAMARVRTASGTVVVRGLVRDLEATTVSGPLLVGMEGAVRRARLETVASEIAFKGDLEPEGRLEAETHGGDVELRLPAGLGATYHLVSISGGVTNELVPPAALHPGPHRGEWSFTTGDGRATVEVRTFKGRVALRVRGKPPER